MHFNPMPLKYQPRSIVRWTPKSFLWSNKNTDWTAKSVIFDRPNGSFRVKFTMIKFIRTDPAEQNHNIPEEHWPASDKFSTHGSIW